MFECTALAMPQIENMISDIKEYSTVGVGAKSQNTMIIGDGLSLLQRASDMGKIFNAATNSNKCRGFCDFKW